MLKSIQKQISLMRMSASSISLSNKRDLTQDCFTFGNVILDEYGNHVLKDKTVFLVKGHF